MFKGTSGFGGGGMFGGGGAGAPNPYAGMNPYGGGMAGFQQMPPGQMPQGAPANSPWAGAANYDPTNAMSQPGAGTPQAPVGAWATNPASAPPWFQAAMQSPGGIGGFLQNQTAQQLAAKQGGQQGQMPQGMPQNFAGILSGLMGGQGFGPQMRRPQQAQQMPRAQQMQRARQPQRQPRLQSGPSGGNVLF